MRASAASRAGGRRDERLEREVGVRLAPREVAAQLADDAAVAGRSAAAPRRRRASGRRPRRSAGTGSVVGSPRRPLEELGPGELLGFLDVGLVERVDAEDGAGDRGGDLPADELGAEVDRVGDRRSG